MPTTPLITARELEILLRRPEGSLANDEYTRIIIDAATGIVRDAAGRQDWAWPDVDIALGERLAPSRARTITLWLAKRAWEDRGNLQRRTAGPISETYFENGPAGLELTPSELEYLQGQALGGRRSGLWVQGVGAGGRASDDIYLPGDRPYSDPILMDDGSAAFAYGEG